MTDDVDPTKRSLDDLYCRPGFLLRRAHQISVALFLEETAGLGLTTTQYGVMVALHARGSLDQGGIAKLIGIDRSTSALVVGKLEEVGYVQCRVDAADKRRKIISLSDAGAAMLHTVAGPARRARQRALQALPAKDAAKFLQLLHRFVYVFNETTRAPIRFGTAASPPPWPAHAASPPVDGRRAPPQRSRAVPIQSACPCAAVQVCGDASHPAAGTRLPGDRRPLRSRQ